MDSEMYAVISMLLSLFFSLEIFSVLHGIKI
jgi:hypothetical protein